VNLELKVVSSIGCRITCATPCEANLRNSNEYIFSIINVMAHRSKGASVGSGIHVATDRSSFTSLKTDSTSNAIQVARKKCGGHHQIIHVEQSISFEPILRQNFCDGDKVNIDLSHVGWP
jgi:hypothetical protein